MAQRWSDGGECSVLSMILNALYWEGAAIPILPCQHYNDGVQGGELHLIYLDTLIPS